MHQLILRVTGAVPAALALFAAGIVPAAAAVRTGTVDYRQGDTALKGFVAWDDAVAGPRPGIVVVPEWYGLNDFARDRARELAKLGYVALAADMYGGGRVAATTEEAAALAGALKNDRPLMRSRVAAAVAAVRARPECDPARVGANGFCFGGTTVLELARSGADVAGVVSFHGGLATPLPAVKGVVKARVLALHGAADPYEPPAEVAAFQQEMENAGVDWQMDIYGHAVHSFTNPASGNDPSRGVAYNPLAAARSWAAMKAFFAELFPTGS
ncbi:MAG: dienelactone hydrolase family protein [Candidatus Krumholzibacteriia bacterium]